MGCVDKAMSFADRRCIMVVGVYGKPPLPDLLFMLYSVFSCSCLWNVSLWSFDRLDWGLRTMGLVLFTEFSLL